MKFLVALAQSDFQAAPVVDEWDPEDVMLTELSTLSEVNQHELASQVESVQVFPLQHSGGFSFAFRSQLFSFVIKCDSEAASSRFISGLELLAAFILFGNGSIPLPRLVDDEVVYEHPDAVIGGGLIRVTFASALSTLKKALQVLFQDMQIQCTWGRASRVEAGLCTDVWAIKCGWKMEWDGAVVAQLHTWAAGRPWKRTCDFARPI
eukprot:Skav207763  [mRNA]  locus=scaffold2087:58505:59125:+ [translate_table: standard]